MRALTEKELELAPEWATHYFITMGSIVFESKDFYMSLSMSGNMGGKIEQTSSGMNSSAVPIVKPEPFNIHTSRPSDGQIDCFGHCDDEVLWTYFNGGISSFRETREDVVNKAKHFKLTAEELL